VQQAGPKRWRFPSGTATPPQASSPCETAEAKIQKASTLEHGTWTNEHCTAEGTASAVAPERSPQGAKGCPRTLAGSYNLSISGAPVMAQQREGMLHQGMGAKGPPWAPTLRGRCLRRWNRSKALGAHICPPPGVAVASRVWAARGPPTGPASSCYRRLHRRLLRCEAWDAAEGGSTHRARRGRTSMSVTLMYSMGVSSAPNQGSSILPGVSPAGWGRCFSGPHAGSMGRRMSCRSPFPALRRSLRGVALPAPELALHSAGAAQCWCSAVLVQRSAGAAQCWCP